MSAASTHGEEDERRGATGDDELLVVSYNLSFAVQKDWLFPVASEWWLVKEGREAHPPDRIPSKPYVYVTFPLPMNPPDSRAGDFVCL